MLFMNPAQALELAGDKPDWLVNQASGNGLATAGERSEDAIRRLIAQLKGPQEQQE